MSDQMTKSSYLPHGDALKQNVASRRRRGQIMVSLFLGCIIFGLLSLITLVISIIDDSNGIVAEADRIDRYVLTNGREVNDLSDDELAEILVTGAVDNGRERQLRTIIKDELGLSNDDQRDATFASVFDESTYPDELADTRFLDIDEYPDVMQAVLAEQFSRNRVEEVFYGMLVEPEVIASYDLFDSLLNRDAIEREAQEVLEPREREMRGEPTLAVNTRFISWLSWDLVTGALTKEPEDTGMRQAILGTLWVISLTALIAIPIGVGAAIYLEEYATENMFTNLIQTNIYNLAGVPSIIYGLLGLAVFARFLEPITNGRTIISASATLALLILPVIIIASQEAIRAVPSSLRQASYGLGATKWQTVWNHVLPYALPGILTGTILAISRAIGETAPLIVLGGATFLLRDPSGPLSEFTALPLQIYAWVKRPSDAEKDIAAAAIIILLVMLLSMNATAVILRNRFSRRLS
jgi:phosphate transport system permease protein